VSDFVGVWAEVELSADQQEKWLAAPVKGAAWKDWSGLLEDAGSAGGESASDLFEGAKEYAGDAPYRVDVDIDDGSVRVRSVLSLDDNMDVVAEICAALRAADKFGGSGDVYVMSLTDPSVNAHIKLGKKGSKCAKAKTSALDEMIEELMGE